MRIQQGCGVLGSLLRELQHTLKPKFQDSINGENIVDFPKNKTDDFILFLKKIREANPDKRIVIILDNFRTHHAKKVKEEAEKMNIALVYLPPYSPDLNPIEYGRVLRELSLKHLH